MPKAIQASLQLVSEARLTVHPPDHIAVNLGGVLSTLKSPHPFSEAEIRRIASNMFALYCLSVRAGESVRDEDLLRIADGIFENVDIPEFPAILTREIRSMIASHGGYGSPIALAERLASMLESGHGRAGEIAEFALGPIGEEGVLESFMRNPITRVMGYLDAAGGQIYIRRTPLVGWRDAVLHAVAKRARDVGSPVAGEEEEAESFALLLLRFLEAAVADGHNIIFVGRTGSGKTTFQMALFQHLAMGLSNPPVIVDTYPELAAILPVLRMRNPGVPALAHTSYYCLSESLMDENDPAAESLLSLCTSGNVGLLVIQEANARNRELLRLITSQVATSGVPYMMTGFASVPSFIPDVHGQAVGERVLAELVSRTGIEFRSAVLICLPALQVYLVNAGGEVRVATRQESDEGRGGRERLHVPRFYMLSGGMDVPPGSHLSRFFESIR